MTCHKSIFSTLFTEGRAAATRPLAISAVGTCRNYCLSYIIHSLHNASQLTRRNIITRVHAERIGWSNAVNGSLFPQTFINVHTAEERNGLQHTQPVTENSQ